MNTTSIIEILDEIMETSQAKSTQYFEKARSLQSLITVNGVEEALQSLIENEENLADRMINVLELRAVQGSSTVPGILAKYPKIQKYFEERVRNSQAFWYCLLSDNVIDATEDAIREQQQKMIQEGKVLDEDDKSIDPDSSKEIHFMLRKNWKQPLEKIFYESYDPEIMVNPFNNVDIADPNDLDSFEFMLQIIIAGKTTGNLKDYLKKVHKYITGLKEEDRYDFVDQSICNPLNRLWNAIIRWKNEDTEVYEELLEILGEFEGVAGILLSEESVNHE